LATFKAVEGNCFKDIEKRIMSYQEANWYRAQVTKRYKQMEMSTTITAATNFQNHAMLFRSWGITV